MTRNGNRKELLYGPTQYGLIFIISTLVWWRSSILSITSLMTLCVGDGTSGLIGPYYGKHHLPWNKQKSWEGSIAFAISSMIFISIYLNLFSNWNLIILINWYKIVLVILISTLVESLPFQNWDNLTVFVASWLSFQFIKM